MADVPGTARCVVIGAGIVGNSLVHHLARLGWRDIVQLHQGPLPNPGGSTGHEPALFPRTRPSHQTTPCAPSPCGARLLTAATHQEPAPPGQVSAGQHGRQPAPGRGRHRVRRGGGDVADEHAVADRSEGTELQ